MFLYVNETAPNVIDSSLSSHITLISQSLRVPPMNSKEAGILGVMRKSCPNRKSARVHLYQVNYYDSHFCIKFTSYFSDQSVYERELSYARVTVNMNEPRACS